jgi:acyl-ACP thioesterase
MKYRYPYTVQYQDIDDTRRLRLHTLENRLLIVAGKVADEMGIGIPFLMQYNSTWIITHVNLEMLYLPTHGEELIFETWIEMNAHMLSVRDFRIYKKEGSCEKLIGCCKIVWAVLDRDKREIINLFDMPIFKDSVDGEVLKMSRGAKMLPLVLDELEKDPNVIRAQEKAHTIQYADMDYNCHCNSTKYLEWMLNARRMQDNSKPFRLDINYVKELYFGDEMYTRYAERAQSVQYQQVDKNGTTCCNARITQIEDLSCK